MNQHSKKSSTFRLGTIVGALAFSLVYLPTAFAGVKYKLCKIDQVKMCSALGKASCVKSTGVAKKELKGYTYPIGGGNSPCSNEPASPI